MSLAIFDLDNTLISGDSDYLWGQFLVEQGVVDKTYYESENARFYQEYKAGTLDIRVFLAFALAPLANYPRKSLHEWRNRFIDEKIKPIMLPGAHNLIRRHFDAGDTLVCITATNSFVTEPIIALYGIPNVLATVPQQVNGQFTGQVTGIPCFQQGKVSNLNQWLKKTGYTLENSWFYSDSHNDLPLLERVDHPVAVDPDDKLRQIAAKNNWPTISLRGQPAN